jgi:glutamate dehydrogenase
MRELSNAPLWSAARAFVLADGAFGLSILKQRVCALDLNIRARTQNEIIAAIAELLRRLGLWFIVQLQDAPLAPTIDSWRNGFAALRGRFSGLISPIDKRIVEPRVSELRAAGMPEDLADDIAILPLLSAVPEIILLSQTQQIPAETAARVFFAVGAITGLDRLRALADRIPTADHWDRLALRRIIDDLYSAQRLMSGEVLSDGSLKDAAAVEHWRDVRKGDIDRTLNFLSELERAGDASISKLALANSQMQKLASFSPMRPR